MNGYHSHPDIRRALSGPYLTLKFVCFPVTHKQHSPIFYFILRSQLSIRNGTARIASTAFPRPNRIQKIVKLGIEIDSNITYEIIFNAEQFNEFVNIFAKLMFCCLCLKSFEKQFLEDVGCVPFLILNWERKIKKNMGLCCYT